MTADPGDVFANEILRILWGLSLDSVAVYNGDSHAHWGADDPLGHLVAEAAMKVGDALIVSKGWAV